MFESGLGSVAIHERSAKGSFDGPNEDRLAGACRSAHCVYTKMKAVNEINIGKTRRAKHDPIAVGRPNKRMASGVVREISFRFDNRSPTNPVWGVSQQEMTQKGRCHLICSR